MPSPAVPTSALPSPTVPSPANNISTIPRRHFFGLTCAAAASLAFSKVQAETPSASAGRIRFTAFADLHYCPGVFYHPTPGSLVQIQQRAIKEKCDMIIHMGDFTHNPLKEKAFVDSYNDFKIPSYHTLGNHDQDGNSFEQTLESYKLDSGYYYFERNGFRFVVLDANYILVDGKYVHYSNGNYYKFSSNEISYIPPEELEWFEEAISNTTLPCILTVHQSCERDRGGVPNAQQVRDIIDRVNEKFPGRVRLFINGHHHRDFLRILNNVVYFDLNSTSHDWVERTHDKYPEELCRQFKLLNHTVAFTDPIHSVIMMDYDGTIEIEGMKTTMLLGVTRESAGLSICDSAGRPVTPTVQSVKLRMNYQ